MNVQEFMEKLEKLANERGKPNEEAKKTHGRIKEAVTKLVEKHNFQHWFFLIKHCNEENVFSGFSKEMGGIPFKGIQAIALNMLLNNEQIMSDYADLSDQFNEITNGLPWAFCFEKRYEVHIMAAQNMTRSEMVGYFDDNN
jgi:hypothetical protein